MIRRTLVANVVGLTPRLIGPHTPAIAALVRRGATATIGPVLPAVTASVQATYLTGTWPDQHGIVGNGWYDRDDAEVRFWRQADALVQKPRVWDIARDLDPSFTCANCFWWNAMYSRADVTITPRPMYPADGRKLPDVWTHPPTLRHELQQQLGQFPLFKFWGPMTSIESTRWIVSSAIEVERRFKPSLNLVYLPHLDYGLQKHGLADTDSDPVAAVRYSVPCVSTGADTARRTVPWHPDIVRDLREVDAEVGRLVAAADAAGVGVLLLSEYGITLVRQPIHLNRVLRDHGYLTLREELGRELLDAAASRAFAVADHQIAHVYVRDAADVDAVRRIIEGVAGVASVYAGDERAKVHLDHDRAGDIIALAAPDAWFTYYYWQVDAKAPDFARTVDIHRKPGYDPAELFLDPTKSFIKPRIAAKIAARKLGMRAMLDVIPLDATLVRGSHGLAPSDDADAPVLISGEPGGLKQSRYDAVDVLDVILDHLDIRR